MMNVLVGLFTSATIGVDTGLPHASPLTASFHGTSSVANTTFGGVIYGLSARLRTIWGSRWFTTPVMCHPT